MLHDKLAPKDDTDPPEGRSGMVLRIDAGTGCQYLSNGGLFGRSALTPRVDADGVHMCGVRR